MGPDKQIKAVEKLLEALERSAADLPRFTALREELRSLLTWLEESERSIFSTLWNNLDTEDEPFLRAVMRLRSERKDLRDYDMAVLTGDGIRFADPASLSRAGKIVVILDGLRSAFNVGSIFRTAECLGLGELALCGITAVPPHPKLLQTAMGTEDKVPWKHFADSLEAISHYRQQGYQIVALETAAGAQSVFAQPLEVPLALILGNESLGLKRQVLEQTDRVVMLPVQGWKNSLNVGVAFAICAYQLVFGH